VITEKRRFVYLFVAFFVLASVFLTQPAQVNAQDWRDFSADVDGDGLPNVVEENGWHNAAGGPYRTDSFDADSDDDGLTDGQEKLYDTDPFNDHSPGIYVEHQEDFQTKQYFPWQRYGSKYIALPEPFAPWGEQSFVVRRGTTFSVGGPVDAEIEIDGSIGSLTTLTAVRDPCAGRWDIYVPSWGTVGTYTITVRDGSWSKSLNLYVIFELPTGLSDAFVDNFLYDDDPENVRDTSSIVYYEGEYEGKREYDHEDYDWIPEGEWISHGYAWLFDNQQYTDYVFEDHVIEAINGQTNTWDAADALGLRVDQVTCFGNPRPLGDSWCVLHPHWCYPHTNINQCTNIAALLVAFNRAAGIPSRPVFMDLRHSTFDHSTEVWTNPWGPWDWYVMRGYFPEGDCWDEPPTPPSYPLSYEGGYLPLISPLGWYDWGRGVFAASENWSWGGLDGDGWRGADEFRQASWHFDNTAGTGKIVKRDWWETRYEAYMGWSTEPEV